MHPFKERVKARIIRIIDDPKTGKPCVGAEKTRRRYIYRLSGSRIVLTKRMTHSCFLHSIIKMNNNCQTGHKPF